jgi:hypothetical protein
MARFESTAPRMSGSSAWHHRAEPAVRDPVTTVTLSYRLEPPVVVCLSSVRIPNVCLQRRCPVGCRVFRQRTGPGLLTQGHTIGFGQLGQVAYRFLRGISDEDFLAWRKQPV